MQLKYTIFLFAALAFALQSSAQVAQVAQAPSPVAKTPKSGKAPAPAPAKAASTKAVASPPPVIYAPKRSFSQWVNDLPKDPVLLVGFIVSILSGIGFLFVIYTVVFELIMGIPFKRQTVLLGGSPINKASSVN